MASIKQTESFGNYLNEQGIDYDSNQLHSSNLSDFWEELIVQHNPTLEFSEEHATGGKGADFSDNTDAKIGTLQVQSKNKNGDKTWKMNIRGCKHKTGHLRVVQQHPKTGEWTAYIIYDKMIDKRTQDTENFSIVKWGKYLERDLKFVLEATALEISESFENSVIPMPVDKGKSNGGRKKKVNTKTKVAERTVVGQLELEDGTKLQDVYLRIL